jgi:hypothetical protein
MKQRISLIAFISCISFSAFVFSCKKDSQDPNQSTSTSLGAQADDQAMVSDENENLTNDVNTSLVSTVTTNGNSAVAEIGSGTTTVNSVHQTTVVNGVHGGLICDASVAFDTVSNPHTITITYDGTNCWGNRTRTGSIVISMAAGVHWLDIGASVTVTINNVKITRVRDGKSIILNGYKTITNVSGGSLKDLASLGNITHTISDSLSVTFADNAVRVWQVSKQRVFTYNNGIVWTTTGTHSDGTHQGISDWGTNRAGITFTCLITQPIVFRQDCDFRLVSGQHTIYRSDNLTTTITYGLDASGNATGCPGSGNYYLEVVWVAPNGKSYPLILPY